MISKSRLKQLSIYKQQKCCDADDLFVVEGVKMAEEALASGVAVRVVCAMPDWLRSHQARLADVECYEVSDAELERLSAMRSPNEVWLLVERRPLAPPQQDGLVVVLDRIQDPGNLGTIIRTADWFGVRHIVCSPDTVSCYNPKVVQATMGGIFRTCIEQADLCQWLSAYKHPVYGALLDGSNVFGATLQIPAALVIGNESRGISPEVQRFVSHRIAIPNIGGTCESLNASVATAVLLAQFAQTSIQPK